MKKEGNNMHQLSPQDLKARLAHNTDIFLIDIREGWEREAFNIGGLHIPMGELMTRLDEIPKEKQVILYCEKGIRSTIAIQRLEGLGFKTLLILAGA